MGFTGRKYMVDESYFEKIDTVEKAYILGVMYSDGTVGKNKMSISLKIEDIELLYKIKECMQFTGVIYKYQRKSAWGGYNKDCVYSRLDICSKKIKEDLISVGCIENKTYILKFPTDEIVNFNLISHFVRGLIDGDGSISFSVNNKITNSKSCIISLVGTFELCKSVKDIFEEISGGTCYLKKSKQFDRNNNVTISIGGNRQCEKILDWLYKDSDLRLNRKYSKYLELKEEIKNIDSGVNINGNSIKNLQKLALNRQRHIVKYSLNNEYLKEYSSIKEAETTENIPHSNIIKCCKGKRKTAGGYIWRYLITSE